MNEQARSVFRATMQNHFHSTIKMAIRPAAVGNQVPLSTTPQNSGITCVDNVTIPYIMRGQTKFVSVKMVEKKLLSKFPKISMDDMNNVGPIYSYYISDTEASLLTEISAKFPVADLPTKSFSTRDLIVSLEDFETFYLRAKNHFNAKVKSGSIAALPNSNSYLTNPALQPGFSTAKTLNMPSIPHIRGQTQASIPGTSLLRGSQPISIPSQYRMAAANAMNIPTMSRLRPNTAPAVSNNKQSMLSTASPLPNGGWVQINNTVVPYVLRAGVMYVPLSVIKYAAGLLTDVRINGYKVPVTEQEFAFLNKSCKTAGVNFTFSIKTKLIKLELVIRMTQSKVVVNELPYQNPFTHAQWSDEHRTLSQSTHTGVHPPRNPFLPSHGAPVAQIKPQVVPRHHSPSVKPVTKQDNQTTALSTQPSTATPHTFPAAMIKSLHFEGKTISCLIRDNEKDPLALLEALVRLYFPNCSISDFQLTLENILGVPVHDLTPDEEAEFIQFYGLRVKSLRCKAIISFQAFKTNYTKLLTIFANKIQRTLPATANVIEIAKPETNGPKKHFENNNNNNELSITGSANNTRPTSVSPVDTGGLKRKQMMPVHSRKNKQPKRLEDTVAKLKLKRETNGSETD